MPRFFFDFREDESLSQDEDGLELPNLSTAELQAVQAAADVGSEVFPSGRARILTVQVRSETGQQLTEVTVSLAVKRLHAAGAD